MLLGSAVATALGGCALLPPAGGPPAVSTPTAALLPGQDAVVALRAALDAAAASGLTPAQAALVSWALDVNDDQHAAVSLPVPPASPAPAPTAGLRTAGLAQALDAASGAFAVQALDAWVARPLVWASMAAWARATAADLPAARASREPARGVLLPAPQEPAEAGQAALDAASAALYGLQVAAGATGLSAGDVAAFSSRLGFWAGLRDDLAEAIRTTSATPTPGPPWFEAERPQDAESARAAAARLQAAALPVLGRTIAHGPAEFRALLVAALADVATDVPRWGGLLQRWPGLPTT